MIGAAKIEAARRGVSMAQVIEIALEEHLGNRTSSLGVT